MAEQPRQELKDSRRSKKSSSHPQRAPWYLQEGPQPFISETSHAQSHIFPLHPSPSNIPIHHSYLHDGAGHSQQIDQISGHGHSSDRPGTPALPQREVYQDWNKETLLNEEYDHGTKHDIDPTLMNKVLSGRRSVDVCQQQQPSPMCSVYASALQGNTARSLDTNLKDQHHKQDQLSSSFPAYSPSLQHKTIQQNVGEQILYSYQHRQTQQMHNSLPGLKGNSPINYNFNQLHNGIIRRKSGYDHEDEIESSRSVSKNDECVEDDEGNHECHNLRVRSAETNREQENHPILPSTQLLNTPTIGGIDFNVLGASVYQGEWPINQALWMSGPSSIGEMDSLSGLVGDDTDSMSFSSSTAVASGRRSHPHQLGTKVEMIYSLLSMLGSSNRDDMSKTLLEMSNNKESCIAMRQSGCLPLLVQILHGTDADFSISDHDPNALRWALREARRKAGQALHNIVYAHPDDKRGRREARVLRLLEQIRDYSDYLKDVGCGVADIAQNENLDFHPGPAIAALMKLSFDEEHRHAMCLLGGLQAIAELIQVDYEIHGSTNDQFCITVRRYAGMALTNLTFGDGTNKALLCSMKTFMQALVAQLHSPNEDLRQVTASVLRNLSWRADPASKQILREVDAVITLMKTAMETNKESTLKSILSALWNLSAHCSVNKADICSIEGALEFLVSMLTYKSASKTISIVENGGGILRNVSSHIAVKEEYRVILRKHNCLQTLLRHLKSPSLTVVSNACGTLWNLSARCQQDQQALWEMGAVGMLRNLIHSKHKMISMGSAAALKNLLAARPPGVGLGLSGYVENGHHLNGSSQTSSPSLLVRKQRALEADIDQNLSETCDNIDSPKTSPVPSNAKKFTFDNNSKPQYLSYLPGRMYHSINGHVTSPLYVPRSESRDSLGSTRSEPPHYKAQCERFRIFVNTSRHVPLDIHSVQEKPTEWKEKINLEHDNNTNIVMQLFKSLHTNSSDSENVIASGMNNKLCSNNLTPTKKSGCQAHSREVNKIENRNIHVQNNCFFSNDNNQKVQQTHLNTKGSPNGEEEIVLENNSKLNLTSHLDYMTNVPSSVLTEADVVSKFPDKQTSESQDLDCIGASNLLSNNYFSNSEDMCKNGANISCISENVKSQKFSMDIIPENVILRKKVKADMSHWSSTSTLKEPDSEDTSLDQTPLAVSRCSSLSSLASCMPHSARNSWISDVSSLRNSGVISPSEIPDSPCDMKLRMSQFTDKAPDAESLGIPRPRPAWPSSISSNVSSGSFSSSHSGMSTDKDLSFIPSNSQQLLHEYDGTQILSEDPSTKGGELVSPFQIPPATSKDDMDFSSMISKFCDVESDESQLDIPNNSSCTTQYNNSNKLHSRVNNLSSSFSYVKSGIPVKSNNVPFTQSSLNASRPHILSSCAIGPVINECEEIFVGDKKSVESVLDKAENPVCDSNDNLLIENNQAGSICRFSQVSQKKLIEESGESVTPCHSYDIEHRESHEEKISSDEAQYFSLASRSHNQRTLMSSPSSEHPDGVLPFSQGKHSRKLKTAIPQIVWPWHPSLDNEVHPKQLQIMSQNLPVYKGAFLVRQSDEGMHEQEEIKEPEIKSLRNTHHQSDPSSVSADSEVSSAELLQEGINVAKPPRTKSKRNKMFRRSTEIPTPEHSSDEDNRNNAGENHIVLDPLLSSLCSEEEEKGKEDERKREKYKELLRISNNIPDLLEGATFHADIAAKKGIDGRSVVGMKVNGSSKVMSDSMELRKGAFMIAAELEELADDQTHSSASCFSDLDNMKPPSVMGEMSMTSSGLSDLLSNGNGNGKCYINGKAAVDRRRSLKRIKKANGNHRFVFKSVLQSRDIPRSLEHDKPLSAGGSIENLSMRSSGTSELLDNINPPSVMEDISMTNSCTSLNSINSDILESRSQSLADARSDSEMFQRLNAAAAMVQVYSRELSNIMTGSMKSSCNSDNLDQVKPPSVFQDIAEVTVEDGTEVCSDAMISDSELEEELPHDDESSIPSIATVHSPHPLLTRTELMEGSTDNLNSSVDGDSICTTEKTHQSYKRVSSLALTPQNTNVINISSNTVQHTKCKIIDSKNNSNIATPIEDKDANRAVESYLGSSVSCRKGPRIVKPINRETIRQMQEKKSSEKPVHSVRGKTTLCARNFIKTNSVRPNGVTKSVNVHKNTVSVVRPTRTSALRAFQSQKQSDIRALNGRVSPRTFLSKPPIPRVVPKPSISHTNLPNSGISTKVITDTFDKPPTEACKPSPPVKQNTFTKDEPTMNVPAIPPSPQFNNFISKTSMSFSQRSDSTSPEQSKNVKDFDQATSATNSGSKVINKKYTNSDVSNSKGNSNTFVLRRNISLPLQKKENSKISVKSSPSNHSLGEDQDSGKFSGCTNSRSSTFCKNNFTSMSSTSFSLKRANSQKEVPSKISSIWKKSENSSSANSPVTDNSERATPTSGRVKHLSLKTVTTHNRTLNIASTSLQDGSIRSSLAEKSDKSRTEIVSNIGKPILSSKTLPAISTLRKNGTNNVKKRIPPCKSQSANRTKTICEASSSSFSPLVSGTPTNHNVQKRTYITELVTKTSDSSHITTQEQLDSTCLNDKEVKPISSTVPDSVPHLSPISAASSSEKNMEGLDSNSDEAQEGEDSDSSESHFRNKKCIITSV